MKVLKYIFILLVTATTFSCSTIEEEKLIGSWKSDTWEFTFEEDGGAIVTKNGNTLPGDVSYRNFINALEFVKDGKVFMSGLTVKSVDDETLVIEFRDIMGENNTGDNIVTLTKE